MTDKRLIDGTTMIEWSLREIEATERVAEKSDFNDGYITGLQGIIQRIQNNHFPSTSNESVLREALEKIQMLRNTPDAIGGWRFLKALQIADEALSSSPKAPEEGIQQSAGIEDNP